MRDERARILELLREGRISVVEAEQLLDALGPAGERAERSSEGEARSRRLCVRITDTRTGRTKTNIRLPFAAWNLLSKLPRTKLGRHFKGIGLQELHKAARAGSGAHILDVTDDDRGERVEVFFE